ncbi:MAG: 2-amino-4-hydroxy-6-hydroxymethyldihydropteridine diphosphokinase [Terricaulis silvestris]
MQNEDLRAFVALGTNLPHRGVAGADLLSQALGAMEREGLRVLAVSRAWKSRAWPPSEQADFVNAVARIATDARTPTQIYKRLTRVERAFGRKRGDERWAARTLDLDLIDVDGWSEPEGGIILPHPHAHERAFVLAPLVEIAPDWRHPSLGAGAAGLLAAAPDVGLEPLGPLHIAKLPEAD